MAWEILNGELRENLSIKYVQISTTEPKQTSTAKKEVKQTRKEKKERPATIQQDEATTKKPRINWPQSNSQEWKKLDTDLVGILSSVKSSAESRAASHPSIIYSFCLERFGPVKCREKKSGSQAGPSRRQRKSMKLREEINKLKEAYKEANKQKSAHL